MAHATARNPRALRLPYVGASRGRPSPPAASHELCGQPTRGECSNERARCVTQYAVLPCGRDNMTQWRDQRIGRGAQHGLGIESVRRGNAVPAHDVRREPCPTKSNNRNTPAPKAGECSWGKRRSTHLRGEQSIKRPRWSQGRSSLELRGPLPCDSSILIACATVKWAGASFPRVRENSSIGVNGLARLEWSPPETTNRRSHSGLHRYETIPGE
jgi:hypothetical protein